MKAHSPLRCGVVLAVLLAASFSAGAADSQPDRVTHANYKQAFHFSSDFLGQFVYSTSVAPQWIGKTDGFWYSYRTSHGTDYWRVNPSSATKTPLFDRAKLATQLAELTHMPIDPIQLPLTRESLNDEGTKLRFVVGELQYEWDLSAEKLTKLGKAPTGPRAFGEGGGRGFRRLDEQQLQQLQRGRQGRFGRGGGPPGSGNDSRDPRVYSPDRGAYLFVRNHNLYLLEGKEKPAEKVILPLGPPNVASVASYVWILSGGASRLREVNAVQLTTNGLLDYSFGSTSVFGSGMDDGQDGRPRVEWARDSKTFYATRTDSRGVQDLFLVNPLTMPRPTLEKYKYPMPGEDAARRMELFVGDRTAKKLIHVKPKWKDESYTDLHWGKTSGELRFLRRDRLQRNVEFCTVNTKTGETKCLIVEGFENANINFQPAYYLEETDEMIWWSERSGWGHFYLYDRNGKLKNAISSGLFRAGNIVAVDAKKRLLYFRGNGREADDNVYYQHLYCVNLDGTGLTLLDPGDANHTSFLSSTRQYVVDNWSRVDAAPVSYLRDATGKEIMKLEKCDLSRLYEIGWKMPETFIVKAADGVTDLYGNMWKPFDFNASKRYPIIVHCYPGPQQEGVTHTFAASSTNQQLAQLGFIVIQVGHRGGAPTRSKAYGSYGYHNLRDYGLSDKKAAVEQLAARCPFIDIERVGIYGHSGGGFMSAAALLQKPYNEFFKAAVASSGNHDNNIYNNGWAERYHGMKLVTSKKEESKNATAARTAADAGNDGANGNGNGSADNDETRNGETVQQMKKDAAKDESHYEIKVPTNAELAANLKGALLLVHGDIDNNVHPANTMRLVDALIKANKRFDMLIMPGQRHGYGEATSYFNQRLWEFFTDHLLGERQIGADLYEKQTSGQRTTFPVPTPRTQGPRRTGG
ncbi:MAG TPA: DPP IV N-terminal domain-containing protein [Gemmataceae bacterium]|jgi:dipeptidyl aminopeptidase/acylaminoacyl peptidase